MLVIQARRVPLAEQAGKGFLWPCLLRGNGRPARAGARENGDLDPVVARHIRVLVSGGITLPARDDDDEYGRWLDEMVGALLPVSRETVAKLTCVRKVITRHWGVPLQRSA